MVSLPLLRLTAGLFGFDKLGFDSFPKLQFYYWGGIPEALRHLGCRVLITKVPRFAPEILVNRQYGHDR
jgi:hypothetical protein